MMHRWWLPGAWMRAAVKATYRARWAGAALTAIRPEVAARDSEHFHDQVHIALEDLGYTGYRAV